MAHFKNLIFRRILNLLKICGFIFFFFFFFSDKILSMKKKKKNEFSTKKKKINFSNVVEILLRILMLKTIKKILLRRINQSKNEG